MTELSYKNPESVLSKKVDDLLQRIIVLENTLCLGKEVLTLDEAALFMGISSSTLYKMTHKTSSPSIVPTANSSTLRSLSCLLGCARIVLPPMRKFA